MAVMLAPNDDYSYFMHFRRHAGRCWEHARPLIGKREQESERVFDENVQQMRVGAAEKRVRAALERRRNMQLVLPIVPARILSFTLSTK
jgi:hypothetical protein